MERQSIFWKKSWKGWLFDYIYTKVQIAFETFAIIQLINQKSLLKQYQNK